MSMKKITINQTKEIAKKYGLSPCRIKGTEVVNIRKKKNERYEDVAWDEFERILKKHGLSVYKATESDFLKLMRDKK